MNAYEIIWVLLQHSAHWYWTHSLISTVSISCYCVCVSQDKSHTQIQL